MTTITVHVPAKVSAPRGSLLAAVWFGRLLTQLNDLAEKRTERRAAAGRNSEAAEVRRFAQSVMDQDPRFAADLMAAADRHQRG